MGVKVNCCFWIRYTNLRFFVNRQSRISASVFTDGCAGRRRSCRPWRGYCSGWFLSDALAAGCTDRFSSSRISQERLYFQKVTTQKHNRASWSRQGGMEISRTHGLRFIYLFKQHSYVNSQDFELVLFSMSNHPAMVFFLVCSFQEHMD